MQQFKASEASSASTRQVLEAQVADLKPASRQAKEQLAELRQLRGRLADLQAQVQVWSRVLHADSDVMATNYTNLLLFATCAK